jgi:adenylate cyclase
MSAHDRHLSAILFTDIVGYTGLMQRNEEEAVLIIRRYRAVLEELVARYGGVIQNDYGDGNLCTFPSALDALQCAVAIQQDLQHEPLVPLRIGLHAGETFHDRGKILGDSVNIASRIQSLGTGNSILFSEDICRAVRNHPEFICVSLGEFDFKNVDQPLEVFALQGYGLVIPPCDQMHGKVKPESTYRIRFSAMRYGIYSLLLMLFSIIGFLLYDKFVGDRVSTEYTVRSIAVLPFENLSQEAGQEYFSNGITEDILNHLVQVGDLQVKSRTSTLQYRNTTKSVKQIGEELGVNHILEGTVRKVDNRVRVVVQLVDARKDIQLWSETYDRELKDILAIQSDIALQTVMALKATITATESKAIQRPATGNIEAYDYFLRARDALHRFMEGSAYLEQALQYVNEALRVEPEFAQAYALKGRILFYFRNVGEGEGIWRDSALFYANESVAIDNNLPDGFFTRALVEFYLGHDSDYKANLIRAFSLAPNDPEILERYGRLLLDEGNELGAELLFKGINLMYSPNDPLYYWMWDDALYLLYDDGFALRDKLLQQCGERFPDYYLLPSMKRDLYWNTNRLNEFLQLAIKSYERYPNDRGIVNELAWANFVTKNYDEAIRNWARYKEFESAFADTTQKIPFRHRLGMVYWVKGDKHKADLLFREQRTILKGMIARQQSRGASNSSLAGVYYDLAVCEAYFGNYPGTMDALEKSFFTYHFFWYWGLRNELLFQQYQGKPEFENFMQRIKATEDFKKRALRNALDNTDAGKALKRQLGV